MDAMCGRFVVAGERDDLLRLFEVEFQGEDLPAPSWNVRPTDRIPVVIESGRGGTPRRRRLEGARWALTPPFSKTLATRPPLFNARAETAAEKPSFRDAVRSRRAIIPASGYYEWRTEGSRKTPFYIRPAEGLIAFAGLYSWWKDAALAEDDPARWHLTATILTRDAVGALAEVHDRTPVALPRDWWSAWLDPTVEGDRSLVDAAVRASAPVAEAMVLHEVAPLPNDDRADMIDPL
jgi:putative SOS response-associated peptidase YedK